MKRFTLLSMPYGTKVVLKDKIDAKRKKEYKVFQKDEEFNLVSMNVKKNRVDLYRPKDQKTYKFKMKKLLTVL